MEATEKKTRKKERVPTKSKPKTKDKVVEVKLSQKKGRDSSSSSAPKKSKPKANKKSGAKKGTAKKSTAKKCAANKSVAKKSSSKKTPKKSTEKAVKKVSKAPKKAAKVSKLDQTAATNFERLKLPSPTKDQLKPFRDAAKECKKMRKAKERMKKRRKSFLAKAPRKGKRYTLDLRVHSPGSNVFQSPVSVDPIPAIVRLAKVKGIDVVGITDHADFSQIDAIKEAAKDTSVTVLPGLDLRCQMNESNWITIICLFPEEYGSAELSEVLERLRIPVEAYGSSDYCLELPFTDVVSVIEERGGVVIPSRIDRTPNQRSAIPTLIEELGFHAFDLVHPEKHDFFFERWPEGEFTFFSFSNANALGQIGSRSSLTKLCRPGFDGLKDLVSRRAKPF
jgi:hypothetical protein